MAAWANEVESGALFERTIVNESIVFYRLEDGTAVALNNRCPHRFAPLHMGVLMEDTIRCPYHGLRFNQSGKCVDNPRGNDHIPKLACVKSYPLIERYNALWIWMGDSEKCTPDTIPEFDFLESSKNYSGTSYMLVEGNYLLESDNILDLSHIEFMHPMFASTNVSSANFECVIEDETVWSKRLIIDEDPNQYIRDNFRITPGVNVDRWLNVRWNAPSVLALWVGAVDTGKPHEEGKKYESAIAHLFTPETDSSAHYFFSASVPHSMGIEGEELAIGRTKALEAPFSLEDKPIIEAVEKMMNGEDFWSLKPLILHGDAPGIRARRILGNMIQRESDEGNNNADRI